MTELRASEAAFVRVIGVLNASEAYGGGWLGGGRDIGARRSSAELGGGCEVAGDSGSPSRCSELEVTELRAVEANFTW